MLPSMLGKTRLAEVAKQRPGLIAEQELDDSLAKDLDAQAKINVAKSALMRQKSSSTSPAPTASA